jgi:hypothetical protein
MARMEHLEKLNIIDNYYFDYLKAKSLIVSDYNKINLPFIFLVNIKKGLINEVKLTDNLIINKFIW